MILCSYCKQETKRDSRANICRPCMIKRESIRRQAAGSVTKAIQSKKLYPAEAYNCVDCGKSANAYDHRDYRKPLEVDPVCRSCNRKRGPALF